MPSPFPPGQRCRAIDVRSLRERERETAALDAAISSLRFIRDWQLKDCGEPDPEDASELLAAHRAVMALFDWIEDLLDEWNLTADRRAALDACEDPSGHTWHTLTPPGEDRRRPGVCPVCGARGGHTQGCPETGEVCYDS